jgi:hypothetical protein
VTPAATTTDTEPHVKETQAEKSKKTKKRKATKTVAKKVPEAAVMETDTVAAEKYVDANADRVPIDNATKETTGATKVPFDTANNEPTKK